MLSVLSLSLLGPSYQDETGAARLQWRQRKWKTCQNSVGRDLSKSFLSNRLGSKVSQFLNQTCRYGRQPPVEPTSPIAMSLNEAGHHHDAPLSTSRSGQILWIRGLTRLQTQVGINWSIQLFSFFCRLNIFFSQCFEHSKKRNFFCQVKFFFNSRKSQPCVAKQSIVHLSTALL